MVRRNASSINKVRPPLYRKSCRMWCWNTQTNVNKKAKTCACICPVPSQDDSSIAFNKQEYFTLIWHIFHIRSYKVAHVDDTQNYKMHHYITQIQNTTRGKMDLKVTDSFLLTDSIPEKVLDCCCHMTSTFVLKTMVNQIHMFKLKIGTV